MSKRATAPSDANPGNVEEDKRHKSKGSQLILGVDLGGTKSAACLANREGEILFRQAERTPAEAGSAAVVRTLIQLARSMLSEAGNDIAGVGVSVGAPTDSRSGRVYDAPNLPSWEKPEGMPLAELLSELLAGIPVYLENDADATALAEHRFGAGRGVDTMAFLTIGTGVGAGLILDGRLLRGACAAGGEIGHIVVEPGGRTCLCGLRGCLEAYASGPSIVRVAVEQGFTGKADGPTVIAAARAGDPVARFAVDQAALMLGRGLATLSMLINPERIVLGTLAVHAGDLLLPTIDRVVRELAWPRIHQNLTIVSAALGDRAQDLAAICAFLANEGRQS